LRHLCKPGRLAQYNTREAGFTGCGFGASAAAFPPEYTVAMVNVMVSSRARIVRISRSVARQLKHRSSAFNSQASPGK